METGQIPYSKTAPRSALFRGVLDDPEITRTLASARNGGRTRNCAPNYQAEAGDHA